MKNTISCLLVLSIVMLHISCNDEYEHFKLKTPPDTMGITAVQNNIVLNEDQDDDVALTFEWQKGADRGKGTEITYYFKLDVADNNMQTSIPMREVSPEQLSMSFTHYELNNLILNTWGITPGEAVSLQAEIIAAVTTYPQYLLPEVSSVTVSGITSYIPKPLFIVGTAAGLEDPERAVRLTTTDVRKEFKWRGALNVGTFYFIEEWGQAFPGYYKGADNNTAVYRTQESDPGEMFTVDKKGTFEVYINTYTMAMRYVAVPPDRYSEVYMVGNGCPAGWDMEKAISLEWDSELAAYVYEGELLEGEIKFPLRKDWSADSLMPPVNGTTPGGDPTVALHPGASPDHKWVITEAGNYRLILDVNEMTISFEKLQ